MALILELPYQDQITSDSRATSEGFALNEISYSGKISQRSLQGADEESSREEIWKIEWDAIEYNTPEDVANGAVDQLAGIRDFYRQAQLGFVRWKPFELAQTRIWRVVANSLNVKNVAGCINTVTLNLEFMYSE